MGKTSNPVKVIGAIHSGIEDLEESVQEAQHGALSRVATGTNEKELAGAADTNRDLDPPEKASGIKEENPQDKTKKTEDPANDEKTAKEEVYITLLNHIRR
ncbi:hypothetical protein AAF712_009433 [Marasmius tenuissimus]|uniref:Uncharacterized protein n=1 Tax=Marasmius tenuissimus TaxID=585030 RepID=A0ABR2ZQV3_9AGAR